MSILSRHLKKIRERTLSAIVRRSVSRLWLKRRSAEGERYALFVLAVLRSSTQPFHASSHLTSNVYKKETMSKWSTQPSPREPRCMYGSMNIRVCRRFAQGYIEGSYTSLCQLLSPMADTLASNISPASIPMHSGWASGRRCRYE